MKPQDKESIYEIHLTIQGAFLFQGRGVFIDQRPGTSETSFTSVI
ncbi:hypothetical protein QGM71_01750 [Virgibacillus sp. C22-A2]|uniref:Uncharacterized protein n=1 Tax=Virgibacillus tibetensis TaxID=3042313 RepID=A0ABU6KAZ5_9BACI|nr:hypothetical protein [Virgibacillus sp. C22-A2]